MARIMSCLDLILVFTLYICLASAQFCAEFKIVLTMDNYMCVGSSYLFENVDCCRSALECIATCHPLPSCHGIFYDHASQICRGCKENIRQGMVNTAIVPAAGSTKFYFRVRAIAHGQPCISSASCATNQYCPGTGVCTCKPGYSYYAYMDNCNTKCLAYGNTYEQHPHRAIRGHNLYLRSYYSPSQCMNKCNTDTRCRTVDYLPGDCSIQAATAMTHPGSWLNPSAHVHYHRNCA